MGTFINDINKTPAFSGQMTDKDMNNLINNIENNIQRDTLPSNDIMKQTQYKNQIQNTPVPMYNPNPTFNDPIYKPVVNIPQPVVKQPITKPVKKSFIMTNIKEFIIIILVFSLFAYRETNKILYRALPMITRIESQLPSLFIRGFMFALTIKLIKKLFF